MNSKPTFFFTADEHYGHANIIKYCNRPFTSVDNMDAEIIQRHNEMVGPKAQNYFTWCKFDVMPEVLNSRRRTRIVIIPGQPFLRMLGKISGMFLKCCKIIKGINPSQIAGIDQAHEQIPNARTIFSFIKQGIFAMQDGFFQIPGSTLKDEGDWIGTG